MPAFGVDSGPAFGEPELGAVVSVLVDEGEILRAGDEAGGEAEGFEVDVVAWGFVVEGEGVENSGVGSDADLRETAIVEFDPL